MKEVDQNDVRSLFTELIDYPPDQRRSILDSTCGGNEVLRHRVLRLLEAHERENGVLEASASDYLDDEFQTLDEPTTTPERIGEYDITRLIAAGGMGLVYEACQEFPRRQVAIKLLRRHLGSRSAYHRFREEAHILARLRHPAIAQIHAASVHQMDGESLPYLVMEYVPDALPITKYADKHELTVEERLRLFIEVCEGVHHGHQKGVIHRDLKPDNILVDANGQPKVVDFGVARVTDSDMAIVTRRTTTGQLVGTLQYMSPEQLSTDADEIDTRTDVYSLGAVLYELLAGQPPIDIRELTIPEALRKLNEESAAPLRRHVPGIARDLELIVRKAIDRDPARRYQTVEALQQDLQRYLDGEAIWARPLTITYKLRVGIRQHRLAAVATIAFILTVLTGLVTTSAGYVQSQRRFAETQRLTRAICEKLKAIDPEYAQGRDVTATELMAGLVQVVDDETVFEAASLAEGLWRHTIGVMYQRLWELDIAEHQLERALEIRRNRLGETHPDTIQTMYEFGLTLSHQLRYDDSNVYLERIVDHYRSGRIPASQPVAASLRMLAYHERADHERAAELCRESIEICRDLFGEGKELAWSINNLGIALHRAGDKQSALECYLQAADMQRRTLGPMHPQLLISLTNTTDLLAWAGRVEEAKKNALEAIDIGMQVFGPKAKLTRVAKRRYAGLLMQSRENEEAETVYRDLLETEPDSITVTDAIIARADLAAVLLRFQRWDEASELLNRSMALFAAIEDPVTRARGLPDIVDAHYLMSYLFMKREQFDEAEKSLLRSLEMSEELSEPQVRQVKETNCRNMFIELYEAWGKPEEAAKWRIKEEETGP